MTLQEIAQDPFIIGSLVWLAFGKYLIILLLTLLSKVKAVSEKQIYRIPIQQRQLKEELKSAWMVITDAVVLFALLLSGALQLAADTGLNTAITLLVFFVWVETWMYWTHRWMHEVPFLRKIHAHHHISVVPHALSSISFSFTEKFFFYTCGWLLFLAGISWFVPVTLTGIVAFYSFYYITSPIAHMNIEMFAPPKNKIVKAVLILGTSTGHAMHHARAKGNYGFITKIYDKLFGTYYYDTEEIQERANNNNGLNKITDKIHHSYANNTNTI